MHFKIRLLNTQSFAHVLKCLTIRLVLKVISDLLSNNNIHKLIYFALLELLMKPSELGTELFSIN